MAKEAGGEKKSRTIEPDQVVERIVRDPARPEARKLVGMFLGTSPIEGHWRLYLNDGLSHYLEFRKEDTLEAQRVSSIRILVWLKPESKVTDVSVKTTAVEFLQGTIQRGNLGVIGLGLGGKPMFLDSGGCTVGATFTNTPNCPPPNTDTLGTSCGC